MKTIQAISGGDVVAILQVGLSGFAFLLMLMCFHLLRREQARPEKPRAAILRAIDNYRKTCLVFAVVVGVFALLDVILRGQFAPPAAEPVSTTCADAVQRVQVLARGAMQDANSLRALIHNGLGACRPADQTGG
jgi:hypothetical protein